MDLVQCVASFNYVCFGMLFKTGLELKFCNTLWSVGLCVCEVCAGLLGEGFSAFLALKHTNPSKKKHLQTAGGRASCKQFNPPLQILCCSLKSVSADWWGIKIGISPHCCPWRGEFAPTFVQEASTKKQTISCHGSQSSLRSLPLLCLSGPSAHPAVHCSCVLPQE